MLNIWAAVLPRDRRSIEDLWVDYLGWVNDELGARYGLGLPVQATVENDVSTIAKFMPPDGRILLAADEDEAFGIACMRRIGPDIGEIKRMYVAPSQRRSGVGGALLDRLIDIAWTIGYRRMRLDSPDFATAAHALYRSRGFTAIEPYPESEIPEAHRPHAIFMETELRSPEP